MRSRGRLYQIPWRKAQATVQRAATVALTDQSLAVATCGEAVRWRGDGRLLRGRRHHCGIATRVPEG